MKTKILSFVIWIFGMSFFSCSDWLDVKPSDRISEENAFSSIAGFKQALNGIYVELNKSDLYGSALSCEFVEILAQRYAIHLDNKGRYELSQYNYAGSYARGRIQGIWQTAYNLIANTNLLIKNCDLHREVLPQDYYHICKGEALALRGLLHFDLFRLFGPVYAKDSLSMSIPYYKEFALEVNPSLPGTAYMDNVINDLLMAEEELQEDPIIQYGVKGDNKDIFFTDRNLRLNIYAVQGLLARSYMYKGDKEKALEYANKVIDVQEKYFPWVNPQKIGSNVQNPDRMFSTEILFSVQNFNRNELFTSLFDAQNVKVQYLLAPRADVVDYVFMSDKAEYRYKSFLSSSVELGGVNYAVFNKYQGRDSLYNQMIPIVRSSEMYMIASEASPSKRDGVKYLNVLRNHRGLNNIPWYQLDMELDKEWLKEMYGEGQLFFYYKRRMKTYMKSPYETYDNTPVKLTDYVLPLPDGETQFN